jgi:hypothetical protein
MENDFEADFDPKVTGKHRRTKDEISEYSEVKSDGVKGKFKGTYTICDIHRAIYDKMKQSKFDREEVKYLIERAYVIAKKMDAKLRMYAHNYNEDWYENEKKNHKEWKKELKS